VLWTVTEASDALYGFSLKQMHSPQPMDQLKCVHCSLAQLQVSSGCSIVPQTLLIWGTSLLA